MSKLDFLFRQLDTLLAWYRQAEEKAKFLVGVNTLGVGVVNALVFVGSEEIGGVRDLYSRPLWLLLGACALALAAFYLLVLRAIWPRHHAADGPLPPDERLWFFGHIAARTLEAHRAAMAGWNEEKLEASLVAQNHALSRNVWIKHEALGHATVCTVIALVLLLALGMTYALAIVQRAG